ncbi:MAG TPA: membrane protein insertase YidC [Phaeodactylibacter sp.]|nr:membrane protein insertase YidC [Phaeodactylibacter sp.]
MDKNNLIGLVLIFICLMAYMQLNRPTPEQLAEQKRLQDSIATAQQIDDGLTQKAEKGEFSLENSTSNTNNDFQNTASLASLPDSLRQIELGKKFGAFAAAGYGTEQEEVLENEFLKVTFTNKGGKIKSVELKKYFKLLADSTGRNDVKSALKLLEDKKDRFDYIFPTKGVGKVRSGDLFFQTQKTGNTITFRADAGNGRYFEQKYTLSADNYDLNYDLKFQGLGEVLTNDVSTIELHWLNYLDKLEKSTYYERIYSSTYFKPSDDDPSYCSCTSDGEEDADGEPVEWVSHANQFFNSALMTQGRAFQSAYMTTKMLKDKDDDLKILNTKIQIPFNLSGSETFAMKMYVGPNEYERLEAYGNDLEDVIPFGRSILGTVNRWIIRPLFVFLSGFIGNMGIVILVLTILVKLVLYPLTYKMLYSQSKMAALKPQLAKMKEKFKDDQQAQQVESMKMYREYGVNPLGGCLPIFIQMPIWIALYRFFPASIEFRQQPFLWAPDLSTFDAFFHLPTEIPFLGSHLSLFTLLWVATTIAYTYYNTKHMDFSGQPAAMKYMQYFMPIMFVGFFNNYASGLTAYLFFSNLFNIGQTLITKNFIINQDKIKLEMEAHKKKPKKKGGFQERMAKMLEEQKKKAAEAEANAAKKKKK